MTKPNHVLLMATSEHVFERYKVMLHEAISSDFALDWVTDLDAGMEMIAKNSHSLCLIDCDAGQDIVKPLLQKAAAIGTRAPFIMLHDEASYEVALEAMKIGASDALDKRTVVVSDLIIAIQHSLARQQFARSERNAKDHLAKKNLELASLCKVAQDYAGNVAHKIRTPLTVIKAFTTILANGIAGQFNTKQVEHLKKILDQTDRLNDMLTALLEDARTKPQLGSLSGGENDAKEAAPRSLQNAARPQTAVVPRDMHNGAVIEQSDGVGTIGRPNTLAPRKGTVLIVDDDPIIIEVFSMLVDSLDFNVLCAVDGQECLARFAANEIDLLILDLAIAGDDGLNIYQKILDLEYSERTNTPAILLTGSSDEKAIARSSYVGAHYVLKGGDAWESVQRLITEIFDLDNLQDGNISSHAKVAVSA